MVNFVEDKVPENYHCDCKYCQLYKGQLMKEDGKYYSARPREGYSDLEKENKHICPGHWHGYAFIIEQYTKEGDLVFDPFAGSGTALIEAAKRNRKALGIELEFAEITRANADLYPDSNITIYEGDSTKVFPELKIKPNLIVTGPPYNNHADPPERKNLNGDDKTFDYANKESSALLTDKDYYQQMFEHFKLMADSLVSGGHMVTIIKDPIRNKEPYMLHEIFCKIMEECGLEPEAMWLHYHWPPTLFMNTYPKRFPEVKIPLYQTMNVFKKK